MLPAAVTDTAYDCPHCKLVIVQPESSVMHSSTVPSPAVAVAVAVELTGTDPDAQRTLSMLLLQFRVLVTFWRTHGAETRGRVTEELLVSRILVTLQGHDLLEGMEMLRVSRQTRSQDGTDAAHRLFGRPARCLDFGSCRPRSTR